jgi:hypothetical protein
MFKKIVTACAAAALGAGLFAPSSAQAFFKKPEINIPANNAATVFTSIDPNVPLTVELVRQNSMVAGTIKVQGQTFPFVAKEQGGYFEGHWEYNGQRVPMQGVIRGNELGIATNGAKYMLKSGNAAVNPLGNGGPVNAGPVNNGPVNPLGDNGGAVNNQPASPFKTVHQISGNSFICPVVGGWEHMEDQTNVMVFSPDKKAVYGLSLTPNPGTNDPNRFLQNIFQAYGVADLKVVSSRELRSLPEEKAIDVEVTFAGRDGVRRHGKMVASIFTFQNGQMGFFQHAACAEENWNQMGPALFDLTNGIKKAPRQAQQPRQPQYEYPQPRVNERRGDDGMTSYYER